MNIAEKILTLIPNARFTVWAEMPPFPPEPGRTRFSQNGVVIDWDESVAAIPVDADITAAPPAVLFDKANFDNLSKEIKALGLVVANFTGKTPAQTKAAFQIAFNSLP